MSRDPHKLHCHSSTQKLVIDEDYFVNESMFSPVSCVNEL